MATGTARENAREIKAGWSIAFWDEDNRELRIGFMENAPNDQELGMIVGRQRDVVY